MRNRKIIVAIVVGDPHGVGSEIVLKSLERKELYHKMIPLIISDPKLLDMTKKLLKPNVRINEISKVSEASEDYGKINVLSVPNIDWEQFKWGQVSDMSGKASLDYLERGIRLALEGEIDVLAYGPLNKGNMKLAGLKHPSETEYMQELAGSKRVSILLIGKQSIVTRVTTHVPLKDVPLYITKENVLNVIKMTDDILRQLGYAKPRIGVGALNPHMGEGGMCGDEEVRAIRPAIEEASSLGIEVVGLYPTDTMYRGFRHDFIDGKLDVGIYMYHDVAGVSSNMLESGYKFALTVGLPVPVLTVGHGTAYPIAGRGEAIEASMLNALRFASRRRLD